MIGTPASSAAARKRLVYMNGDLIQLPSRFWDIFKPMHPFNKSFFNYFMEESRRSRTYMEPDGDMSVHEFMVRRFDPQFAELLADPFCRGITAGNSRNLSLRSMFPVIFNAHEKAGSVLMGMSMFKSKLLPKEPFTVEKGDLFQSTRKRNKRWTSFNFRNGLSCFSEGFEKYFSLLEDQPIEIIKDAIVDSVEFDKNSGTAKVTAMKDKTVRTLKVAHVFSSVGPQNLSACLKATAENDEIVELKSLLDQIKSVDVAVVTLEFEGKDILAQDAGFGFLVPSGERDIKVLGITFDSCVFQEHDGGKDITRITVSVNARKRSSNVC